MRRGHTTGNNGCNTRSSPSSCAWMERFFTMITLVVVGPLMSTSSSNHRDTFVSAQVCIDNLQDLFDGEQSQNNPQQKRTYILCPNTNYDVAHLDYNYNLRRPRNNNNNNQNKDGPPIPLRSNLHIKCGSNGSRTNNCSIRGGHLQVDGTTIRGLLDQRLDNVILEGLTFQSSIEHSVWITKPGSITFRDCVWTDHTKSKGPVMLDFYSDLRPSDQLEVKFIDSKFLANRYFGLGAQASMVISNSEQNILHMERTVFEMIDMKHNNTDNRPTYLVESLGRMTIQQSCFIGNQVAGSPVAIYGNELVATDIHLSASSSNLCSFASVFETLRQYETKKPRCIQATSADCPWINNPAAPTSTPVNPAPPMPSPTPPPPPPPPTPSPTNPPTGSSGGVDDGAGKAAPLIWPAVDYDASFGETTRDKSSGGCNAQRNDGVDAQVTSDDVCRTRDQSSCNIGWWEPGEQLVYNFDVVAGRSSFDVRVRAAAKRTGKNIVLSVLNRNNNQVIDTYTIDDVKADGWQNYNDLFWRNVNLSAGSYELYVSSTTGSINVCSVAILLGSDDNGTGDDGDSKGGNNDDVDDEFLLQVPGKYSAMFYRDILSIDTTPTVRTGNCPYRLAVDEGGGIDAQINTDSECQSAIQPNGLSGTACNIGWVDTGESLVYDIVKNPSVSQVSMTLRVASPSRRPINVDIYRLDDADKGSTNSAIRLQSTVVYSPGNPERSWKKYDTIDVWNSIEVGNNHDKYRIRITFPNGRVNMCSIGIQ